MRLLSFIVCMLISISAWTQSIDIMSSPFRSSYIGFKMESTQETHKFFLEYRGISTDYNEIYDVLKSEFDYGVRLVYTTTDQNSRGVFIIFHNSLLYNTIISKMRKCIQQRYKNKFKKELDAISYIGYAVDVAYGRIA